MPTLVFKTAEPTLVPQNSAAEPIVIAFAAPSKKRLDLAPFMPFLLVALVAGMLGGGAAALWPMNSRTAQTPAPQPFLVAAEPAEGQIKARGAAPAPKAAPATPAQQNLTIAALPEDAITPNAFYVPEEDPASKKQVNIVPLLEKLPING